MLRLCRIICLFLRVNLSIVCFPAYWGFALSSSNSRASLVAVWKERLYLVFYCPLQVCRCGEHGEGKPLTGLTSAYTYVYLYRKKGVEKFEQWKNQCLQQLLYIIPYFSLQNNGHNDQFISHLLSVIFKKNTHFDKCHLLSFMLISLCHTEHINKEIFGMDIRLQAC